jgi:hypothetical protein
MRDSMTSLIPQIEYRILLQGTEQVESETAYKKWKDPDFGFADMGMNMTWPQPVTIPAST